MGMRVHCPACGYSEVSDNHRGARLGTCPQDGSALQAPTAWPAIPEQGALLRALRPLQQTWPEPPAPAFRVGPQARHRQRWPFPDRVAGVLVLRPGSGRPCRFTPGPPRRRSGARKARHLELAG